MKESNESARDGMNLLDFLDLATSAMSRALKGVEIDKRMSGEVVLRVRIQNGGIMWQNLRIDNISVLK